MRDMSTKVEEVIADAARLAVIDTAGDESAVGGLRSVEEGGNGLVSVRYECTLPGYLGWDWTVDLAVDGDTATVCESALLPGEGALLAPGWVPWSERVQPGDLEPGMVLPFIADDPRLVPGYTATDDEDLDRTAIFEFGLGRERVLAPESREAVADRWYRGSHGPSAASAVSATATCSTCAFWAPMAGSFRLMFGACTNEWSPSDGRVVSVDHGCGAHSQTEAERRLSEWPGHDPVINSGALDVLDLVSEPEPEPEPEPELIESEADAHGDVSNEAGSEASSSDDVAEELVAEDVFEKQVDEAPLAEDVVEVPAVEDEAAAE